MARETIAELWDLMCDLDRRVSALDKKINAVFKADPACRRIARIKGVGPKTATAMVAAVGDGADFKNGRHLSPRLQYATNRTLDAARTHAAQLRPPDNISA